MKRSLMVVLAIALAATSLSAHKPFKITGTIVSFVKMRLEVRTAEKETFVLTLQEGTPIRRNKKPVTMKELVAGRRVVADVVGDTLYDSDLFVSGVTLLP